MKVKWLSCSLQEEDIREVNAVLRSGDFSGFSSKIGEFEQLARAETGARHAIAVANGTCALMAAFLAYRRYLGRELTIAVPTWTYIAPVNCADLFGRVRLIDSERRTHNLATGLPEGIDLIAPVDMAGLPADYDALRKYGLPIVADAAESLGATYHGRKVGVLADISITSFHSSKVITTGEGGMIFTENDDLAKICRDLINQGYGPAGYDEHHHVAKGFNFRMTGLQAALGCSQIKRLPRLLRERKEKAARYDRILSDRVERHFIPEGVTSSYYSYVILLPSKPIRDALREFLRSRGIETKLWTPVHRHPPYQGAGSFPVAEYIHEHHLRLPIHNDMTAEEITYVAENVLEGLDSGVSGRSHSA